MNSQAPTRVFAGLDEAGLGPLLGPMTMGWSAFRVPRGTTDLWQLLAGAVTDNPRRDADRLVVADSKRVFSRSSRGAKRLELTSLAFLDQLHPQGRGPRTPAELFELPPPDLRVSQEVLARHPWYEDLPERLPYEADEGVLAIRSARLARELERQGVALVDAGCCVLPVGELNDSWSRTDNKSLSQWQVTGRILLHLWERYGHESLSVFVDRLGGRRRYGRLLGGQFPSATVQVVSEQGGVCEYVLGEQGTGQDGTPARRMRVVFAERCEERSFSVALGSCLAKYGRELGMTAFNRYFGALQPGLKPTAGYTTDGRRWLQEAQDAVTRAGVSQGVLIRNR